VRIRTLYPDGNTKNHYQVLRDSARILACLVSGLAPRLLAAVLSGPTDIVLFFLFDSLFLPSLRAAERLLASTIIARVISSIVNLLTNRRAFSAAIRSPSLVPVRYGALWLAQLLLSWSFVYGITSLIHVHDTVVKIFVDFALGLIGSQVRLRWVFGNRDVTTEAG
jgi:hypothetical protein